MLKFHPLRIADLHPDADEAVAISLDVPAELRPQYTGLPGQHVVLRADVGGEEARRTYSLVSRPGEWPLRIVARVHQDGRMSRHLAEQAKVGDRIDVLPPNGSLTPRSVTLSPRNGLPGPHAINADVRSAEGHAAIRTYVGFAAGCGITPILAIARSVLESDPSHRFILFYGNKSTGRAMCLEDLLGLKDRFLDRLSLHFVMSREPQEVELYNGRVDAARVRELARTLFEPTQVAEFFVCGPGDMIDQVSAALRDLRVDVDRIHGEHFNVASPDMPELPSVAPVIDAARATPAAIPKAAAPELAAAPRSAAMPKSASIPKVAEDAAEVTVLMDGRRRSFTMRMNDEIVLDAAARAGLDLPFSCRAGVCSTCRTKVVSGEVEMEQNYALEDWEVEQGYVLACQSRCKTPTLELDYDEK